MKFIGIFIVLFVSAFNVAGKEMVMMDHSHMPIDVPDKTPAPALSLHLTQDAMSGYNLTLLLQNYSLIPPPPEMTSMPELMHATLDSVSGFVEGHAHLYINGNKVQRIYGNNIHLSQELFHAGINNISVTLNNHGHMYWVADKRKILATLYIEPAKTPLITYKFESFPIK